MIYLEKYVAFLGVSGVINKKKFLPVRLLIRHRTVGKIQNGGVVMKKQFIACRQCFYWLF